MANSNNILSDDMGHVIPRKDYYNKKKLEQKFNQMRENQNKEIVDLNFDLTSGWDKDIFDKKKAEYEKTGELILPDARNSDIYKNKMEFLEERKEYIISTLGLDIDPGKWNSDKITEEEGYFVIEQHLDDGYINLISIPKYKAIEDCKVGLIATGASSSYPDDLHSFLKNHYLKDSDGETILICSYKPNMANDDFKGFYNFSKDLENLSEAELREMGYYRESIYSSYYMPVGRDIVNHGLKILDNLNVDYNNINTILGFSNGGLNAMKTAIELLKVNPDAEPLNLVMCDEWQCTKYYDYIKENIDLFVKNESSFFIFEPFLNKTNYENQKPNTDYTEKDRLYALYAENGLAVVKIPVCEGHASKYKAAIDAGIFEFYRNGLHLENANKTEQTIILDPNKIYLLTGSHMIDDGNGNLLPVCDWHRISQDFLNDYSNLSEISGIYNNIEKEDSTVNQLN